MTNSHSTVRERIGDIILDVLTDNDDVIAAESAAETLSPLVVAYRGAAAAEAEVLETDPPPELFGDAAWHAMLDSYIAAYRKEDSTASKQSLLEYFEWPDTLPNEDDFPIPVELITAIGVQMARRDAADAEHLRKAKSR